MPWDHCDVEFILDDEACPRCGVTKDAWTVQAEKTRHLRIGRKKRPRAAWDSTRARVGDEVGLRVEDLGLPDGSQVAVTILEHDQDGAHDRVDEVSARVEGGVLLGRWRSFLVEDADDWPSRYELEAGATTWPELFFELDGPAGKVRSGAGEDELLRLRGEVDERLVDALGRPRAGVEYELRLPDGTTRRGRTDDQGRVAAREVLPREYRLQVLEPAPPLTSPSPPPSTRRPPAGLARLLAARDERADVG